APAETKLLEDREVHLLGAGSFQNIPRRVSKQERLRRPEGRDIEPALDGALAARKIAVADAVRALPARPCAETVLRGRRTEHLAAHERVNSVDLPAAQDLLPDTAQTAEVLPSCAERQLVVPAQHHAMADVEIGVSPVAAQVPRILWTAARVCSAIVNG